MTEQTTLKAGCFARSLAGHDKGQWYVIVKVSDDGVYVADGRLRTIDHPKRKNPKHLQPCRMDAYSLLACSAGAHKDDQASLHDRESAGRPLRNEQIKYVLRQFAAKMSEKELEDEHVKG